MLHYEILVKVFMCSGNKSFIIYVIRKPRFSLYAFSYHFFSCASLIQKLTIFLLFLELSMLSLRNHCLIQSKWLTSLLPLKGPIGLYGVFNSDYSEWMFAPDKGGFYLCFFAYCKVVPQHHYLKKLVFLEPLLRTG